MFINIFHIAKHSIRWWEYFRRGIYHKNISIRFKVVWWIHAKKNRCEWFLQSQLRESCLFFVFNVVIHNVCYIILILLLLFYSDCCAPFIHIPFFSLLLSLIIIIFVFRLRMAQFLVRLNDIWIEFGECGGSFHSMSVSVRVCVCAYLCRMINWNEKQ